MLFLELWNELAHWCGTRQKLEFATNFVLLRLLRMWTYFWAVETFSGWFCCNRKAFWLCKLKRGTFFGKGSRFLSLRNLTKDIFQYFYWNLKYLFVWIFAPMFYFAPRLSQTATNSCAPKLQLLLQFRKILRVREGVGRTLSFCSSSFFFSEGGGGGGGFAGAFFVMCVVL